MKRIKVLLKEFFLKVCYLLRDKRQKSVYFRSFTGQYSDNPRAISEAIHELDPTIDLVWFLNKGTDAPTYVRKVFNRFKAKIYQVQANAWVLNNLTAPSLGDFKGKKTFYVQTWHGDRGFKRVGWSKVESLKDSFNGTYSDSQGIDLFTAGSSFGIKLFSEGFLYKGEVQLEGTPRNDKLVRIDDYVEYSKSIKKKLRIEENIKVLLYAPTFRDCQESLQEVVVDISECLDNLESNGEKWICLLRSHSNSKGLNAVYNERMIDVSGFGDMADLLLITDCLITDYSSCSCDYILTGRPCVLALFDEEEYNRPLWVRPDEVGFLVAKNQKELNKILFHLNEYDHKVIDKKILDFYETKESGCSSMITAKRILDQIRNV